MAGTGPRPPQKPILTSKKSGGNEVLTQNFDFFAFWLFFSIFFAIFCKKLNFGDFSPIFRLNLANATFANPCGSPQGPLSLGLRLSFGPLGWFSMDSFSKSENGRRIDPKNHDFQKIHRKIMKISKTCMKFREESIFDHPRVPKLARG